LRHFNCRGSKTAETPMSKNHNIVYPNLSSSLPNEDIFQFTVHYYKPPQAELLHP